MAHTCDRCRTTYESGAFYKGHDYCSTCYARIIEEERRKKLEEERQKAEKEKKEREQKILEKKKQELLEKYDEEKRMRRLEEEKRRKEEIIRQSLVKQRHAREKRDFSKLVENFRAESQQSTILEWETRHGMVGPSSPRRKPLAKMPKRIEDEKKKAAAPQLEFGKIERKDDWQEKEEAAQIELSVKKGLPVSLSLGQRGIKVDMVAKNQSQKSLLLELSVSIEDAAKKEIKPEIEPEEFSLGMNAEASLSVVFDLPEGASTGPLTLKAQLHENAVYVDRESAKSGQIVLTSQVKTPMDLEYVPQSVGFCKRDGTACLKAEFTNRGESGGILDRRSNASYGTAEKMMHAQLEKKVKIKGGQKKIELIFSPAQECEIERVAFELLGVDSNGKEYKYQKSFNAKAETQEAMEERKKEEDKEKS